MEKDRIDIIFNLLDENGKSCDKLDISSINTMISEFANARRLMESYYGIRSEITLHPLEIELRWLKGQMFDKNVEVVHR